MLVALMAKAAPPARGYHLAYRDGEINYCPGCGRTHWYIGRLSAECAFCGTALPIVQTPMHGAGTFRTSKGKSNA